MLLLIPFSSTVYHLLDLTFLLCFIIVGAKKRPLSRQERPLSAQVSLRPLLPIPIPEPRALPDAIPHIPISVPSGLCPPNILLPVERMSGPVGAQQVSSGLPELTRSTTPDATAVPHARMVAKKRQATNQPSDRGWARRPTPIFLYFFSIISLANMVMISEKSSAFSASSFFS